MKPSRASITLGGPFTPSSASSTAWMPSREAWPACSRLMSAPPLTKANRPGRAGGRDAERIGDTSLPAGRAAWPPPWPRRTGPSALVGWKPRWRRSGCAGAREADRGLVACDHGFDQRASARLVLVADAQRRGHDDAAAMRRAGAVAVVELDAVRRRAAEEGGVEQVGASARPGTGMRPGPRTAASTVSARVATSPPAPAIMTPTVSSRWRRA